MSGNPGSRRTGDQRDQEPIEGRSRYDASWVWDIYVDGGRDGGA